MKKDKMALIEDIAKNVFDDAIVSASEWITVSDNSIDSYVDGLIENDVDTSGMTEEEVEYLKSILKEKAIEEISESKIN